MKEARVSVDGLTRLQLLEMDTCARCAHCAEYCPTYTEVRRPGLIPGGRAALWSRLVGGQRGILARLLGPRPVGAGEAEAMARDLYYCSLCGRCETVCPFSIRTHELWEALRSIAFDADLHMEPLRVLDANLAEKRNPYGADPDLRSLWVENTDLREPPVKKRADTVYFVGCTTALRTQCQDIAAATSAILSRAGEDWTILGDDEWCCGSPSLMIGDVKEAAELAKHNTGLIESVGAKRVVTGCPACYRTLRFRYPRLLGRRPRFDVVHTLGLLHDYLWRSGRILVTERFQEAVAYHDPCELGRLSGILREPREVLAVVAERPVELPESGLNSRCCGGGGLLQAVDADLRMKIARHRVGQAQEAGAKVLTSACPSCKITLMDAIEDMNLEMGMFDLTELVAQKMGS